VEEFVGDRKTEQERAARLKYTTLRQWNVDNEKRIKIRCK